MSKLEMAHATRWDGHWGRLRWTGFRSIWAMRDLSLTLRVPGKSRLKLTVKAEWWGDTKTLLDPGEPS